MQKKWLKIGIIALLIILLFVVIVYCDLKNIFTNLGLSISFWSGMVTGAFPIILTIYLWKKEEKDRKKEIAEESKFQKKLIIRTAYISYFENFLEQINKYSIFIKAFILMDKDLIGRKIDINKKISSLIEGIYIQDEKIWEFNYKVYAFKSIDIDIYNYNYNGKIINLTAYMPYIVMKNELNKIYKMQTSDLVANKAFIIELDENDIKEIAKSLLDSKNEIKKFLEFLEELKNDIEERIVFD